VSFDDFKIQPCLDMYHKIPSIRDSAVALLDLLYVDIFSTVSGRTARNGHYIYVYDYYEMMTTNRSNNIYDQ
jgi:hypothetical protein